jgi:hypothetical protein
MVTLLVPEYTSLGHWTGTTSFMDFAVDNGSFAKVNLLKLTDLVLPADAAIFASSFPVFAGFFAFLFKSYHPIGSLAR